MNMNETYEVPVGNYAHDGPFTTVKVARHRDADGSNEVIDPIWIEQTDGTKLIVAPSSVGYLMEALQKAQLRRGAWLTGSDPWDDRTWEEATGTHA